MGTLTVEAIDPTDCECCILTLGEGQLVTCSPLRADATKLSKNGGEKDSSQMPTYHALLTGHMASAQ
eukprot:375870-Amphidinium_carterae.2